MPRTLSKNPGRDLSRLRRHAKNTLGVIMTDQMSTAKEFRDPQLDLYDRYYENSQYDDLTDWEDAVREDGEYIPIRQRKPRIIYNLAKVLVDKVAAKLVGSSTFPQFIIEDDDEDTAFFRIVQKAARFRSALIDPVKHLLTSGAVFVRFYMQNGTIQIEHAKSKYCYPTFDSVGELESVDIKYVFEDQNDKDSKDEPKKKWYKLTLTKTADILWNNPEYRPGVKPEFEEVARADHGLGWVQGEWLVTHKDKFDFDGISLFHDVTDFIDELNYSLSQSSQASAYSQEPQITIKGVDEDELDRLVKSSQKAWNLGREGEAKYLESNMKGIEGSIALRDKMKRFALDVARVELHDPEQIGGNAQSGEALKLMNAPLVELVDELRAILEHSLTNLLLKISMTALHYNAAGEETVIETPTGYFPNSLDITVAWPPIFPPTLDDINKAATAANALSMAQIVSREALTRWIAPMLGIDNVEEELSKIASQEPLPSAFGTFGGP